MRYLSTATDSGLIFFKNYYYFQNSHFMSNLGVSAGLHSIQFPKSLIMMCLKILLASLQSAIHLREAGTETEIESKSVYS